MAKIPKLKKYPNPKYDPNYLSSVRKPAEFALSLPKVNSGSKVSLYAIKKLKKTVDK